VKLQPAGWCRRVNSFVQRDKADTDSRQLVEQQDQVSQVSSESVQPPAHQRVHLPTAGSA
jgi:hypothetical protein